MTLKSRYTSYLEYRSSAEYDDHRKKITHDGVFSPLEYVKQQINELELIRFEIESNPDVEPGLIRIGNLSVGSLLSFAYRIKDRPQHAEVYALLTTPEVCALFMAVEAA